MCETAWTAALSAELPCFLAANCTLLSNLSSDQTGAAQSRQIQAERVCPVWEALLSTPSCNVLGKTVFSSASCVVNCWESHFVEHGAGSLPRRCICPSNSRPKRLRLNGKIMSKYIPSDCCGRRINEPLSFFFSPELQVVPTSHSSPLKSSFWVEMLDIHEPPVYQMLSPT